MSSAGIQKLLQVMRDLRAPETGCPWDLVQTHKTLEPYFVEELHEFLEALEESGSASPKTWEELGDVLFQIVYHSQLLAEKGLTDFDTIAGRTAEKLIERHPHVFDPAYEHYRKLKTPEEVNRAWEQLKARRKALKGPDGTAGLQALARSASVKAVPPSLPSLQRSARIGEKAASWGFDWPEAARVLEKVREEVEELRVDAAHDEKAQEELGDLFFALAQYARKRRWDPEDILDRANRKFTRRFEALEAAVARSGKAWEAHSLDELEALWQANKKRP